VCEYRTYQVSGESREVEIIAHFLNRAMVAAFISTGDGPKKVDQAIADCFFPIRTAEEIAEESRAQEICEIRTLLEAEPLNPTLLAYAIHAAGYRKQVQP
jgi:hypothetical protein